MKKVISRLATFFIFLNLFISCQGLAPSGTEETFWPRNRTAGTAFNPEPEAEEETERLVLYPSYLALTTSGNRTPLSAVPNSDQTSLSDKILWDSDDEGIATVDDEGVVTPIASGTTMIRARLRGLSGSSYVVVREEPATADKTAAPPPASSAEETEPVLVEMPSSTEESVRPSEMIQQAQCDRPRVGVDPFADQVVEYQLGIDGGFNEDLMPEIVLGPPRAHPASPQNGSTHVFSLGIGGKIILEFTDWLPCDGPGTDLIVFENPMYNYTEWARVAVSQDGLQFYPFPCFPDSPGRPGCAGVRPVFANPEINEINPTDPDEAGGDLFDLADVGLDWARFILIRDLRSKRFYGENKAGFDLDAAAVVNGRNP